MYQPKRTARKPTSHNERKLEGDDDDDYYVDDDAGVNITREMRFL